VQEQTLQTGWDNFLIKTPFVITGLDIAGEVNSGGEPVADIQFLLFSSDVKTVKCPKPQIAGFLFYFISVYFIFNYFS
jgi:hypothetical protein